MNRNVMDEPNEHPPSYHGRMVIGERLRETRNSRGLSLTDVAGKAAISAATLSRIENGKQGLDFALFLTLARILAIGPAELLNGAADGNGEDPLAGRIASLAAVDRAKLWRELAETRRRTRRSHSSGQENLDQRIEELFAQFEFLHEELDAMRTAVRRRKTAPKAITETR
jgi:transcriptional regulator with XRE-family HTH domain